MKKHIPNSLTLLNLFCGCCGIVACLENKYSLVPIFIGVALVADFLDGFVARLLKVKSDLGAQLDSLADMTTFGVLPGMMLFSIINNRIDLFTGVAPIETVNVFTEYQLPLLGFAYALFACLRLAKFNIDTRQTVDFIGLNTPSGAIFVLGFYMQFFTDWIHKDNWDFTIYSKIAAIILSFILSFLMVAEFTMFSLKGNPFDWKKNKMRVLLLISTIPQLIFFKWLGLSTIILSYVVFAFLHNTFEKKSV